jgi:hypothetical protein
MNGTTIASEGYLRTVADLNWKVAGVGDFNGDLKADILWRNTSTGENYIYLVDGTTLSIAGEAYLRSIPDQNWQVAGIGNFDGSTGPVTADILWRNRVTGENYIYFMSGTAIANEGYLRTIADRNWQVAAVGNFDGNTSPATADILWRNAATGENYIYLMAGTAVTDEGYLRTIADRAWKAQPVEKCPTISSSTIALSAIARRVSGVAPLAVFFDATGTTATATTRPFHALEYHWNFGDEASGLWTNTPGMPNLRRNEATGPVAAHLFEKPGTYTVCVSVFDGANVASTSIKITVTDPNAQFLSDTLCVGQLSVPPADTNGGPSGATRIAQSSFHLAISQNIGTKKRILFRRGDTFTSTQDANINVNGPGIIGAFGTGNAPIVNITGNNRAFKLSDQDTPTIGDWRIMDLEINGNSGNDSEGVYGEGGINQVTALRLDIHHVSRAFGFSPFTISFFNENGAPGHILWDQLAIMDNNVHTVIGGSGGNGAYVGSQRLMFMGNKIRDTTGAEHVIRLPYTFKGVISHNDLSLPADAKIVVKMQAAVFQVSPTAFTEQIVLSDNKFETRTAWNVGIGPQDANENEHVRNVIVERNWFVPNVEQNNALLLWGVADVTVRNNLFNMNGAGEARGITTYQLGIEGNPSNVHVYNNTFYDNTARAFIPIEFGSGTGHIARNNLGYSPIATGTPSMVSGTATTSNNTANVKSSPSFVSATPSLPTHFGLAAASNAINQGTALAPVFSDLSRLNRPLNGGVDLGAMERY